MKKKKSPSSNAINFSLNNFGVCPSTSNPIDGFSAVVLLSHQRGKKQHKTNKQTKPQSVPSSNAI
jgi:hypothetical protein